MTLLHFAIPLRCAPVRLERTRRQIRARLQPLAGIWPSERGKEWGRERRQRSGLYASFWTSPTRRVKTWKYLQEQVRLWTVRGRPSALAKRGALRLRRLSLAQTCWGASPRYMGRRKSQ